jgi:7,8-dihydropterin-6-yl-methyl-4-(beta-D-ribofuranosyl)aminobenzene 5'-phosphate synthase
MMSLAETAKVAIMIAVDNYSDVLLESVPGVDRYGKTDQPLLAEHGFSVHVRLGDTGKEILLDAGVSPVALPHNFSRLGLDPRAVSQVVISHGHPDHTGALEWLLTSRGVRTPVVVHPDAFFERWRRLSDGSFDGPRQQDRQAWEEWGAAIVSVTEPYDLAPGCLATGPVPRRTDFEKGTSAAFRTEGSERVSDQILDDQSIAINVKDKGLVVISGCAHAGIVNTVLYAREITGVDEIWAVLGGFHLGGASEEKLASTISELKALHPALVMPCHCTGFEAVRRFAEEMPSEFVVGAVGTTLKF